MKALWRAWTWLCAVAGHVGAIRVEVDWHRAALDERLCDGAIRALYAAATAKIARPKGPCGDHRRRGVKFDPGGLPHFHGEERRREQVFKTEPDPRLQPQHAHVPIHDFMSLLSLPRAIPLIISVIVSAERRRVRQDRRPPHPPHLRPEATALLLQAESRLQMARRGPAPATRAIISHHQRSSAVISHHQRSSVVISGHQWSSVVISGHQWSSVMISGHQWYSASPGNGHLWYSASPGNQRHSRGN